MQRGRPGAREPRETRLAFLRSVGAFVLFTVVLVTCGGDDDGSGSGSGSSDGSAAEPIVPAQTGEPFAEPLRVAANNGVLAFDLVASGQGISVAGTAVRGRAYDDSLVGPTLVVNSGDTIALTLDNQLDAHTNVHFHGMHVSPAGNGDNIFLSVEPGEQFAYSLPIPDEPSGRHLLVSLARARHLRSAGVRRAVRPHRRTRPHRAAARGSPPGARRRARAQGRASRR